MSRNAWAVILAGGDGVRLRSMTRGIAGDDRPKQFCALVGEDALLTETRRRAALAVPAHRTLVVVNRAHERFYTPLLADLRVPAPAAQPENRGTAPAMLYALLVLAGRRAGAYTVAFFPSDHYLSDDVGFMGQVELAFEGCARRPDLVTLLGIAPDRPEPGYGWIEPGESVAGVGRSGLREVRRFWEKPEPVEAERFRAQGWLWNSFVMGRARVLHARAGPPHRARSLPLLRRHQPDAGHGRRVAGPRAALLRAAVRRLLSTGPDRSARSPRRPAGAGRTLERLGRSGARPRDAPTGPGNADGGFAPGADFGLTLE